MKIFKSYIDNNGKLAIPAKIRKKLHLNIGDQVTVTYNNSELIVSTFHANIEKVRDILNKYENLNLQPLPDLRSENVNKE